MFHKTHNNTSFQHKKDDNGNAAKWLHFYSAIVTTSLTVKRSSSVVGFSSSLSSIH